MTFNPSRSYTHGRLPANYIPSRYYFTGQHNDRVNASFSANNILPDVYPQPQFTPSSDLSRAFRVDAHLLAIIRIEDKRNSHYATEVIVKLRQKEQTQSFINKPCSLFITERSFIIFDRGAQVIAETIPLENLDPTCVYSEGAGALNDVFMYRLLDRNLTHRTSSQASNSTSQESSSVIVFKCSNKDSVYLVDQIRGSGGKPLKTLRSARSTIDRRTTDNGGMSFYDPHQQPTSFDHSPMIHPTYAGATQPHTSRTISQQHSAEHYKQLTEELNKCFDDIELFVRYLESLVEYTKELERDHRRKDKKSASGLKHMIEKIPDDRYFIDILQKFKHSFNLLGELKHIIHNPNAPELVHYLLSPLQFIVYTLRSKHPQQLQIAQDITTPGLTREARELLVNCLTSKEHEILRNLGPTWFRTTDESPQKYLEYRPVFFEGRAAWLQDAPGTNQPILSARTTDERQSSAWQTTRSNPTSVNNSSQINHPPVPLPRQPSPAPPFETSTIDRGGKSASLENFNAQMQNEHAWAIERKRAGAKMYVVKSDRQGQNPKELTVRRGELIEIESSAKKWWRARNYRGDVGHVPHNIVEEIEIEQRPIKSTPANPSAFISRSSSAPNREMMGMNNYRPYHADHYPQYLLRSPSHGNNFIMQSTNGSNTPRNQFYQPSYSPSISSRSSPAPPPPPAPPSMPPPPPPPPLPADFLMSLSSPWSTLKLPTSSRSKRSNTNPNDSVEQVDEFQQELTQRLTDRVGSINQNSSKDDVQRWLISKNVSSRLAQNLRGMNGEEIFQVSKETFDQFTDPNESARVFSLLSQQKKLSGYRAGDTSDHSPVLNHTKIGSLKSSAANGADENLSFRLDDTLTRSLKIKLKQRRDKIEQAQPSDRIVL